MRSFYFLLLFLSLSSCIPSESPVVAIQPFGDCTGIELDSIADAIQENYSCEVIMLKAVEIPEAFFISVKTPRYRADSLLLFLNKIKPAHCSNILGVTRVDISTTKRNATGNVLEPASRYQDWGVFGLGQRPGSACVISSYRLPKSGTTSYLIKVALHELGHNFGLPHCEFDEQCVMRDAAEKLSTLNEVTNELCDHCRSSVEK